MKISRRNLPLNAMRAFEAAARHCHMRRAAEELGVTHGAISRQVRHLEDMLDVILFDRSHNRLSLTTAGQRLQGVVQSALDDLTEGLLYLDAESMSGSLVVAATPSISVGWLLALIGQFSQKYPEVELQLKNINPRQRRMPAAADLVICYGEPEVSKRKQLKTLFREQYFPVCSPAIVQAPVNRPRDLFNFTLLHDQHGRWQAWFAARDIEIPASAQHLVLEDSFQVINAVREGCGIGLADRIEVGRDLRNGSLISLFESSVIEADHSHYLLMDKDEHITVRARLFVDFLLAELAA